MSLKTFTHDDFLSHSAKDKEVARSLAERLRQDGQNVWPVSLKLLCEERFDEWAIAK